MSGNATQAQISSFLTALRMKGETIDEITACATVMRDKAVKLSPPFPVMDIVGTGGDEVGTFNISTTIAFVAAAGLSLIHILSLIWEPWKKKPYLPWRQREEKLPFWAFPLSWTR